MVVRRAKWSRRLLALGVGWVLLELLVLPFVAHVAPLRLRVRLPAPLRVLGEPSKAGFLPRDYVLVLGDSYAEGHGDWLTAALQQGGDPAYQATHVLHALTARDVVSLGSGGADTVSGTAFLASKRFASLWRTGLGAPRDVFVYVYEGNDLNENLKVARKRLGLRAREFAAFGAAEIDAALAARAAAGTRRGLLGTFFAPYVLFDLAGGRSAGGLHGAEKRQLRSWDARPEPLPEENAFRVGERWHQFTPLGQAPGLELDAEERRFALALVAGAARWTARRFPAARVRLVYLPAPLSCYEILSPKVRAQSHEGRGEVFPARLPWERTDELRREVAALATAAGVGFVDATDELRAAARATLLHGPNDAKHLNRAGYTVLARVLARALAERD